MVKIKEAKIEICICFVHPLLFDISNVRMFFIYQRKNKFYSIFTSILLCFFKRF